jgi:hypothetical protein
VAASILGGSAHAEGFAPNADFATVQKHLDPGGSFYFYLDTDDFFATLGADVLPFCELLTAEMPAESLPNAELVIGFLRDRYPGLGLGSIAGFGSSGRGDGSTGLSINRAFLHLRGERVGLMKLTTTVSRPSATLNFPPGETMIFSTARTAPAQWIATLRETAALIGPQSGEAILNMGLAMMDMQSQMPMQKILESIDGEVALALAPQLGATISMPVEEGGEPMDVPRPDVYLAVQTTNPLLRDSLKTRLGLMQLEVSDQQVGNTTFSVVPFPDAYEGCQLSFTHDGSFFYASNTSAELLAAAIERQRVKSGGLAESAELAMLTEGLPTEYTSLVFVSGAVMPLVSERVVSKIEKESEREIAQKMSGLLGSLYSLHQRVAISRNTEEGIEWVAREKRDSRTTIAMIGAFPIGIATAIAVPSFLRAREFSQRNACQENQAKIDAAKQQWALETNAASDAVPTWEDLVGEELYLRRTPVCPTGGTYAINGIDSNPSCSHSDAGYDPAYYHTFPGM